ncbi:MAG: cell division protein SepF [Actinomycetia bacterium]|nr:cell division protein SepF [Actinomycetes bacterium]
MGIWDNLKSRFGGPGNQNDNGRTYDEYDSSDAYLDTYGQAYQSASARANNSADNSDYEVDYLDNSNINTPLVNMSDIRSQQLPLGRGVGSREDRIPMPAVRERHPAALVSGGIADIDSEAFRDSLARSNQNSLVQLHSERIQLEANAIPEFDVTEIGTPRNRGSYNNRPARSGAADYRNSGVVTARGPRSLEHLSPHSYADAEAIAINLRQGAIVILDLNAVRPELAKRILDFAFGVTSAFEGQVDRYADRVYILTRNGALTNQERDQIHI